MTISTLHQLYNKCREKPKNRMLGKRKKNPDGSFEQGFTWYDTENIFSTAEKFGSGLVNLKLIEPTCAWQNYTMKFIGIFSINTVRLLTADIACGIYNFAMVPFYETLGEESFKLILDQTQLHTCIISAKNAKTIITGKQKGGYSQIKTLIILDSLEFTDEMKSEAEKQGIRVILYEEVLEAGEKQIQPWAQVTPDTIYAFSYTSGTTGDSKGAMISHKNICSVVGNLKYRFILNENDSYLSYLPMPHVMERVIFNCLLYFNV